MIIKLVPQIRNDTLQVTKVGNTLVVNGEIFDFSLMTEGATLPRSAIRAEWFVGDVDMEQGELVLTMLLPIPWNYSPEQALPSDLVDVPDGAVALPQPLPTLEMEEEA
jgi:hypothetical protein